MAARRAKGEGSITERESWQFSLTFRDASDKSKRIRIYAKTKSALDKRITEKIEELGPLARRDDGTITKSKRWQFSLDSGKSKEGKRRRTYIYADSRAELIRKMADERARSGGTFRARSRDTIGEWVEHWLEHEKKPSLASSTFAVYEVAWRVHAKPLIGTRRLDRFSSDDVARVYAELRRKQIGGRTVQVVAKFMRAAFDAAIRREKYPHAVNPWRIVPVPRHTYKEARVLTAAEAKRFLAAAQGDRYEAVWALALFGGLRLGECLGLKWEDVDLDSGELRVRQQATEVYGRVAIGPLKTKSSRRNLVVTGLALEALCRRKAAADAEGHGSPYVFTAPNGALLDRNNIRRRHFAEVCKLAEITDLRPHDLRHTMTSHAIAAGLSPIAVAQRLGHGSTRMTLDRYGHAMPGQQKEAAAVLERRLGRRQRRGSAK